MSFLLSFPIQTYLSIFPYDFLSISIVAVTMPVNGKVVHTKAQLHTFPNPYQDENKKKEEKKAEPKPEPKPFKMPKKVEKKPEPEPEPVPEEPKKIVKKKPSARPKEEPKEEEAPFAMKLKKTERVQREWKDPEMETVKLAHHEFEKAPQPVEV